MLKWVKIGRTVSPEATVNIYAALGTQLTIESRKKRIPHANGVGYWEKTFFYVLENGKELKMLYSLADAKDYAEKETTK